MRSPKAGIASGARASASGWRSRPSCSRVRSQAPRASSSSAWGVGAGSQSVRVLGGRLRLGRGVEQQRAELDRREAVDHAVVGLADEPDAAVAQPVGDPELPQRAVAAQRLRQHRVGELRQVLGGGAVDVLGGVEVLGVDPQRRVQPERVGGDPLAEARRAGEPPGDVGEQVLEVGARAVLGRLERRRPPDVHVCARALDGQKRRVERRQPLGRHPVSSQWFRPQSLAVPRSVLTLEASRPRVRFRVFYGLFTAAAQMSPEKVSQAVASPSSKPRLNQPARCSAVPCVNVSGLI